MQPRLRSQRQRRFARMERRRSQHALDWPPRKSQRVSHQRSVAAKSGRAWLRRLSRRTHGRLPRYVRSTLQGLLRLSRRRRFQSAAAVPHFLHWSRRANPLRNHCPKRAKARLARNSVGLGAMARCSSLLLTFAGAFLATSFLCDPLIAQTKPSTVPVALAHVTTIDVRTGALQADQTVLIEGTLIRSVGPSTSTKPPQNARSIDCTGLFLIPGLWDMHVHLEFGDWFPHAKEISLPLFIANGVTGVRDMGSELETLQAWRKEIGADRLIGPRILTSGPMLDGPKPRFPSSAAISTPEDGRRAFRH